MIDLHTKRIAGGFSLIEVSLALMLIGGAALGLLSLFPRGLEQAEMALNDSNSAMLAREFFADWRAYAATVQWKDWPGEMHGVISDTIPYPDDADTKRKIYYELSFSNVGDSESGLVGIHLLVQPTATSKTKWRYYTEVFYAATAP